MKAKTVFYCSECGNETAKWMGQCPACGAWNTLTEAPKEPKSSVGSKARKITVPKLLSELDAQEELRFSTGIREFDRVLGGGVVPGSVVLLGGDPGIGKSTLLMQTASNLTSAGKVLYVTGEESSAQLKLRAERLGARGSIYVLADTTLSCIEDEASRIHPDFLIIDSIQTMYSPNIQSAAGSVTQIRDVTATLTRYAKSGSCAVFIVGHVTKEGALAGPRVLEHMVDTVLYFEGDRHDSFRLLRAVKNRFGSTNEIGVFEMTDTGIESVTDTASVFLSERGHAGCAVTAALEGTRPILVEVQALLSSCPFNNPRRMAMGFDTHRLQLMLAVLEQKAKLKLYDKDVYINAVGGIRIDDRANDLAICLAVASAYCGKALGEKTVAIGEVGLTGELRSVSRIDARLNECIRLGFNRIVMPKMNSARMGEVPEDVEIVFASTVNQAIELELGK